MDIVGEFERDFEGRDPGDVIPRPQACDRRVIVLINVAVGSIDIDRHKFAVIRRAQGRPHLLVEDVISKSGEFIEGATRFDGWHGRSSSLVDRDIIVHP
jgi:hypothetical protein